MVKVDGDVISVRRVAEMLSYRLETMAEILDVPENATLKVRDLAKFFCHPDVDPDDVEKFLIELRDAQDRAISTAALAKNMGVSHSQIIKRYKPDVAIPQGPDRRIFGWSFNRFKEKWENRPRLVPVDIVELEK